jgi:hypothetical protein
MLREVQEQQASEIFLGTLAELVEYKQVYVEDRFYPEGGKVVGKARQNGVWQVSTKLALEAVQESLRRQGRSPLRATERALLDQLRQDGKLTDGAGDPLSTDGRDKPTRQGRVGGRVTRTFFLRKETLLGPEAGAGRGGFFQAGQERVSGGVSRVAVAASRQ